MKWWGKRQKQVKLEQYQKDIYSIKQQQSLQLLELVRIALDGLQEIGVPETEADVINKQAFIKLFDDSIIELQRYASTYKSDDHCNDYELTTVEQSLDRQTNTDVKFPEILSLLKAR